MIFMEHLPANITEQWIANTFSQYGRVVDYVLQPNPESGELEAYVEFLEAEPVRKIALQGEIDHHGIQVYPQRCRPAEKVWHFKQEEQKRVIYVSNLPNTIDKRKLRELFSSFGKITEIRLTIRNTIAFAYVDFETEDMAAKSLCMNQKTIHGKLINVAISDPRKKKVKEVDPRNLFITNLPFSILEQDLKSTFSCFGEITELRLARDEKGRSKGTAFISFSSEVSPLI